MRTRLATLLLGLVQVVLGAALVLDLVSVRQLARDTGADVALLITVAAHASLRHVGAQVLEIALVVVGVALLASLARTADLGARWPRRAWVALALLAVGLAALTLHAPHAARLVGRLAAAGPALFLPSHSPPAGAAQSAPAQRPQGAGRRIEDGSGPAALGSAPAHAERPAAEARAGTVSLPIVRKQAGTPPVVVQPASDAIPPPSGNPHALVPGQLRLAATFSSVGVELRYAGDTNANGTATLEFRKAGETEWRRGLPLWRVAAPNPAAFYGSALLLEPGELYTVRVTLGDPDGVLGPAAVQATIATRAESIPPASALAPTHYVRAGGFDNADGRGPATAWRTLEKAFVAAPPGAVVQVGPGYYRAPRTVRTQPLDLVAQYPAVGDDGAPLNLGQRSVVEGGAVAAAGEGRWQQVALVGPATGRTFRVWRWARSGTAGATQLGYAATRADLPRRAAHWKAAGPDLRTPAGWAEKLYANLTYSYGFYVDGEDIYLRLPGDANPNDLYVGAGNGRGLRVNGPNVRISGFELRHFGEAVVFDAAATGGIVDHALFAGNLLGVSFRGAPGPPAVYGGDHVVERNVFRDSNLWSADPAADPAIPWPFVKLYVKNADGSDYPFDRIGEQSESTAVGGRGGAQRVVVRYNVIDGTFNGLGPGEQADFDRYAGMDMDIQDNLIRNVADDAFEPERQSINLRIWRNRVERAAVVLSTGPVQYGPVYLFRNQAWRIGADGVGRDRLGDAGVASLYFKYSGSSQPTARIYVLHNTFWTDRPDVDGSGQFAGGGAASEAFYLRNNVIHATRYAFSAPTVEGRWDEDSNAFSTTDRTRG
ncbi:MAG: hypothetical protein HY691_14275, partial [Chloroflexi bacterium]|nr:hypothetical protein [Chloroflexota bacterium]